MQEPSVNFPNKTQEITESIKLPSNGIGYSPDLNIPLTVNLRPIKAQEEKIIFSNNYDLNKLMTVLLGRCIMENFDPNELYEADRTYLLFKLRSISYSSQYNISTTCKCGALVESNVNLDELPVMELEADSELESTVELPHSKYKVALKFLRGKDTEAVIKKTKANPKESYIEYLVSRIESIEGFDKSYAVFKRIIPDLIGKDSVALKNGISKMNFGLCGDVTESCPSCGTANKLSIEVTEEFFRPKE